MEPRFISREQREAKQKVKRADAARRELDGNPESYIKRHTIKGHAFESHVAISETEVLDNVVSGRKLGDTKFTSEAVQNYCIQEVLYKHMQNIQEWARTAKPDERILYAADFLDENDEPNMIGSGFISDATDKKKNCTGSAGVNYIESNIAGVVIKKNPEAPDGWEITTAFPMSYPTPDVCTKETVIATPRRDFSKVLHRTPTYQQAPDIQKLYLDIKASSNTPPQRFGVLNLNARKPNQHVYIFDRKAPNAPRLNIDTNLDITQAPQYNRKPVQPVPKSLQDYAETLVSQYTAPQQQTQQQSRQYSQPTPTYTPRQSPGRSLAGLDVNTGNEQQSAQFDF